MTNAGIGSQVDQAHAIAVDASGSAYVAGFTYSTDFPVQNPYQPTCHCSGFNPSDTFVAKLNPAGSALVYATYLGGAGYDAAYAIAVDASGAAYVAGETDSGD